MFSEYGASFLPQKIDPLGAVSATVDCGLCLISFTQWHNELMGYIKAKNGECGVSLSGLADAINIPFWLRGKVDYSLEDWDVLLKPIMPQLQEAFSSGQFSENKELRRELKRRLGGNARGIS